VAERLEEVAKARSKAARREAEKRALELILLLWEQRSNWPSGWPPEGARQLFDRARTQSTPFDRRRQSRSEAPRLDALARILDLQVEENQILLNVALLELDAGPARELLRSAGDDSAESPEDVALLNEFIDAADAAQAWARANGARSKKRVRELAREEIRRVRTSRNRLTRSALAD